MIEVLSEWRVLGGSARSLGQSFKQGIRESGSRGEGPLAVVDERYLQCSAIHCTPGNGELCREPGSYTVGRRYLCCANTGYATGRLCSLLCSTGSQAVDQDPFVGHGPIFMGHRTLK